MKRLIILFISYTTVFLVGYIGLGVVLHFVKPEVKFFPKFVRQIIDKPANWSVQEPDLQDISAMNFRMIGAENNDPNAPIVFTDDYNSDNGIFCFRGNAQRTAPTRGLIDKRPTHIRLDWIFETETDNRVTEYGSWGGGSGWTGQALVVKWPQEIKRKLFQIDSAFLEKKSAKEVIIGSLCGAIYFMDWETGKATRPALSIQNPIKGTVSIDPRMNGLLYVGQGIQNGERFGAYVFDQFKGEEILYRSGIDQSAIRKWGAFDSNSIIDSKSGYWFHPAENGQIYKTHVSQNGIVSEPVKFNYSVPKSPRLGIESSMAAWNNLGFFADNGGTIFCLDLMTFQPIWLFDNEDDTDASMVIDLQEKNQPFLYIANEVDKQGANGVSSVRKLDAQSGELQWTVSRKCAGTKVGGRVNSGGVLATVLTGKKKASHLVYTIFSRVNGGLGGEFVAIDKRNGKEQFSIPMDHYSWSSPIDVYDKEGNCYVFFTDVYGYLYLIDGVTGELIEKQKTDGVYESSAVAWGNRIVMGGRGNRIYSFVIE